MHFPLLLEVVSPSTRLDRRFRQFLVLVPIHDITCSAMPDQMIRYGMVRAAASKAYLLLTQCVNGPNRDAHNLEDRVSGERDQLTKPQRH